jgi:hypothetical protein
MLNSNKKAVTIPMTICWVALKKGFAFHRTLNVAKIKNADTISHT